MTDHETSPVSRTWKDYLGLVGRGFAMGASDIVPGVSGGTMALILGIYEELINSIKAVLNRDAIRLALGFKIAQALELVPWKFLASVAGGIFLAIFTMSYFLEWVLERYPSLLWAFFFGLVLASVFTVSRQVQRWGVGPALGVAMGAVGAYLIVGLVPTQTPDTWWFLFLSGTIAICAMVLPGVSGAFILVLLGKYQFLLSAVTSRDIVPLALVVAGAGVGIVTFAQVLSWLFKRYHDSTVAVLTGMLIGSLRKIWPWKETIETMLDRHGKEIPIRQVNILPVAFDGQVVAAIALAAIGCALIVGLNAYAARRAARPNQRLAS